jgi:hypothetical protein
VATIHALHPPSPDGTTLVARLGQLVRLELELGLAEARQTLRSAIAALAVGVSATILGIAALVVLLAGVLAPAFGAPWAHLVVAGGATLIVAAGAAGWSVWRLKHLRWPRETLTSVEENWRWLGAQLKSRLTSK